MPTLTTHSTPPSAADGQHNLSTHLQEFMARGKLTIADLALLLGRPFPTVRMWVRGFTFPSKPRDSAIWERINRLEKMLIEKRGLPVPGSVCPVDGPAYIKRLVNGRSRFPGSHVAKRKRRTAVRVRKGAKA